MKRVWIAVLCLAMLCCLLGCDISGGSPVPGGTGDGGGNGSGGGGGNSSPVVPMQYNIVTGLEDIPEGSPTRPIGIMLANDVRARPQGGIDEADMIIEIEYQAGVTRLLTVFGSADKVPDVNPIRSARSPMVQVAQAMGLVYVHAGGSEPALNLIATSDIDNLNAGNFYEDCFWYDDALYDIRGAVEYTYTTNKQGLQYPLEYLGYDTAPIRDMPYAFGTVFGGETANVAEIRQSYGLYSTFVYDEDTALYTKYIGDASSTEKHVSLDGDPLQFANVIALYGYQYYEWNEVTINYDFTSGYGKIISGGKARDVTYELDTEGFTIYEMDGTVAKVARGKTYIGFINDYWEDELNLA
ncbi:MAG: DUF3048 domain-containing protein [Clostridia bacterium]|nr:DUF3048 domain-containing protein [Clostridia bacterium]